MAEEEKVMISDLKVSAYKIPTEKPESDGTLQWNSTTLVLTEARAGDVSGIGYSYADQATAILIRDKLKPLAEGKNAFDIPAIHLEMLKQVRNIGNTGIAGMAISAVDNALWDLKARLLNIPLCTLLGRLRDSMPLYGSGGFTSYSVDELQKQLSGWAEQGIKMVKMKVGTRPADDLRRVEAARKAIGEETQLFVDANGAYSRKEALHFAEEYARQKVSWFEEPVSSDDLEGLAFIRNHAPAVMNIAAGEYGYNLSYFQHMLITKAVDVLQADVTRCGGISTFLKAGTLCEASHIPLSAHTAPMQHLHAALALPAFVHAEYFFDHVRIENMLFDSVPRPQNGSLYPDLSQAGNGLTFKHKDAAPFAL